MKLYFATGACSLSPHIVLREAGLDFEMEQVDLGTKKTAGGADFTVINPKGYVPALQLDSGELLTEGTAIVQYLADLVPEKNLLAAVGNIERYRQIAWLNFVSTELHKSFSPLFNPQASDDAKNGARANLTKRIGLVAKHLESASYLGGDHFTVADAYLFVVLSWSGHVKFDLGSWPVVTSYLERIAARPAVQAALVAEGLK